MKLKTSIKLFLFVIGVFIIGYVLYEDNLSLKEKVIKEIKSKIIIDQKAIDYEICLNLEYKDEMKNEEIITLENEIETYASKYKLSYKFATLDNDYSLSYKETTNYFAASLYKLLDLIYLVEKDNLEELSLDEEIKYSTSNYVGSSEGMKDVKNGTLITLRELLSYILEYSDNTAHNVLLSYISKSKLRELGTSLGAKNVMNDYGYGRGNVNEIFAYLVKVNELISVGNENSEFIKNHMDNDYYNAINIPEVRYYHKWGGSENYFHNVGIAIDNDYMIIIMSQIRHLNYTEVFNKLSSYFYNLNNKLINSQEDYCNELIYGGTDGQ